MRAGLLRMIAGEFDERFMVQFIVGLVIVCIFFFFFLFKKWLAANGKHFYVLKCYEEKIIVFRSKHKFYPKSVTPLVSIYHNKIPLVTAHIVCFCRWFYDSCLKKTLPENLNSLIQNVHGNFCAVDSISLWLPYHQYITITRNILLMILLQLR